MASATISLAETAPERTRRTVSATLRGSLEDLAEAPEVAVSMAAPASNAAPEPINSLRLGISQSSLTYLAFI
ncbi:MAG: hypothetical protein ABW194_01120 [Novosphingobium sp.]